ncbi:MAG TPA: precorrin-6y C5,15-methyltransferase (decarboxylating) subunit CbiE, partial [Nitrospirae bacterium]|nr:precorrin-6y C5,15-methyltransferase (decarboxylating) subunit CbiE [Nitrospirota bacterium]HEW81354.1 precorrin-6y C5,15-methyltransferase (decarboxylating) subunit CbiE [Nitrospirota bacterium]
SEVVLTNKSLHDVFKRYDEYESVRDRIIVHGTVYEMLDYIADNFRDKKIALIGAGDPMFFGIGRLVIERFGQDAAEVYPDLSSMQVAFSRVKETLNNALLISLHGGPDPKKRRKRKYGIAELSYLLKRHDKIGILTDRDNGPDKIAKEIFGADVQMYVCEKIGYDDEKIIKGTPEEIAGMSFEYPNVVIITSAIVQKCNSAVGAIHAECPLGKLPLPVFGLKENEIEHSRGLITKDEVRAVTIHKLRLPQKGVFWDVGAGSGSVSIEVAGLFPGLRICAVEKNDEQAANINENINKFSTNNIELIKGSAPEALKNLPAPDRVFIGGSGGNLSDIITTLNNKMDSGIVVINAVTIETLNEAVQSLENSGFRVDISEVSISRSKPIGDKKQMSALNPIFIISGEKNICQAS